MKKVLVVGDFMLDEYIQTKINRLNPESPAPLALFQDKTQKLGGAGNVAHGFAKLGYDTTFLCMLGTEDSFSYGLLEKENIHVAAVPCLNQTTRKVRIICGNHYLLRLDYEDQTTEINGSLLEILELLPKEKFDLIAIIDYDKHVIKGLTNAREHWRSFLSSNSSIIVGDLKPKNFEVLLELNPRPFHCILPNEKEMLESSKQNDIYSAAEFWGLSGLMERCIVTRGEDGYVLIDDGEIHCGKSLNKDSAFDVCGCGDSFTVGYSHALLSGMSEKDAASLGNVFAGISVHHLGNYMPSLEEISAASPNGVTRI